MIVPGGSRPETIVAPALPKESSAVAGEVYEPALMLTFPVALKVPVPALTLTVIGRGCCVERFRRDGVTVMVGVALDTLTEVVAVELVYQ